MNIVQSEDFSDTPLDLIRVILVAAFAGALIEYLHTIVGEWFFSWVYRYGTHY